MESQENSTGGGHPAGGTPTATPTKRTRQPEDKIKAKLAKGRKAKAL